MGGVQSKLRTRLEFELNRFSIQWESNLLINRQGSIDQPADRPESNQRSPLQTVTPTQRGRSGSLSSLVPSGNPAVDNLSSQPKCTICLGNYRLPIKILECGHSFCGSCLCRVPTERYLGDLAVRCPICRHYTNLPRIAGIRGLPRNIALEQLLADQGQIHEGVDTLPLMEREQGSARYHFRYVSVSTESDNADDRGTVTTMEVLSDVFDRPHSRSLYVPAEESSVLYPAQPEVRSYHVFPSAGQAIVAMMASYNELSYSPTRVPSVYSTSSDDDTLANLRINFSSSNDSFQSSTHMETAVSVLSEQNSGLGDSSCGSVNSQ